MRISQRTNYFKWPKFGTDLLDIVSCHLAIQKTVFSTMGILAGLQKREFCVFQVLASLKLADFSKGVELTAKPPMQVNSL